MSRNLDYLLETLNQQAELIERMNEKSPFRYKCTQRLVLENGKPFLKRVEPTPFKGKPKSCFQNCFELVWKYPNLSYCEGFAVDEATPLVTSHAWLLNENRSVIDPTWVGKDFGRSTYFGVVFNREFVIDFANKTKVYGILDSDYLNDDQLLKAGFPKGALLE